MVDVTVDITLWVTGVVFIAVNLFMAVCVIKFRHKQGQRAKYEPENKKLETWLTILTSVGVAAMLTPGLVVWGKFVNVPGRGSRGRGRLVSNGTGRIVSRVKTANSVRSRLN